MAEEEVVETAETAEAAGTAVSSSSSSSSSASIMSEIVVQRVRTKYHWPAVQLNFWMLMMLISSCVTLGIFAFFVTVQRQLLLLTPWYVLTPFACTR